MFIKNTKKMEAALSHLLVPVDYSDKSVFGLKYAVKLNKVLKGKITFINVIKGVDPIWSEFFTNVEREILLKKLQDHLHNFVTKNSDISEGEYDCLIAKGKLCDTIMQTAESLKASAIVMGTSHADNIKKKIIGTNALRIVSEAKCPVITIKAEPDNAPIKRLILPLDISKETREKVVDSVDIARKLDAEILVVSAYSFDDELIFKKMQQQQDQVVKYITDRGIKCSAQLLKVDDNVDGVLNFIDTNKGDMVIITTHQQLEIVTSFVGSFAKSIVSRAKVPVMSIVPRNKYNVIFKIPAC